MRRIAAIYALAVVLVLTAAATTLAAPIRNGALQPTHLSNPSSYGEWIQDAERPPSGYRTGH